MTESLAILGEKGDKTKLLFFLFTPFCVLAIKKTLIKKLYVAQKKGSIHLALSRFMVQL